jgi:SAM-dependent methyltransferase
VLHGDSVRGGGVNIALVTPATIEILVGFGLLSAAAGAMSARMAARPRAPLEGQRGKDIPWVPTPPVLVEKMLDMANVGPDDYVVDLGSGDGRIVIAAAQRGARALGIEFDPALVQASRESAARAGVADRAAFVQGDFYEADITAATVLALFLLPENLRALAPKFCALKPGTRIVANRFGVSGWTPDATCRIGGEAEDCPTAVLYSVPGLHQR